jgi:hypothetical protein
MLGKLKAMIGAVNKRVDALSGQSGVTILYPDSDNTWTSSVAYTAIAGLTFTPELNALYRVAIMTVFTAGTAEDFRYRVTRTGLSDADFRLPTTTTASGATVTWNGNVNSAGNGITVFRIGVLSGFLETGANAGTVVIQGSQQVSGINTTTLYDTTNIIYTRIR